MKYELSFIISPAIAETDHPSVNQEVLDYLKGIDNWDVRVVGKLAGLPKPIEC